MTLTKKVDYPYRACLKEKDQLKGEVRSFWNQQSCDTQVATAPKYSERYFREIEDFRYRDQPFIHAFAQFTRYRGQRILEVGFGARTDFVQWLRAGAVATGIDLTPEASGNRLGFYHCISARKRAG